MEMPGDSREKSPVVLCTEGIRTLSWNAQSATSLYAPAAAAYAQLRSVAIVYAMAR